MFTTNSFACYCHLDSRSRENEGRRAENTSLDRLRIYSRPVTNEEHVCQTCRGPPGDKPWHTFNVPGAETTTRLPSTTPWRHHWALRHDYQASLRSASRLSSALVMVSVVPVGMSSFMPLWWYKCSTCGYELLLRDGTLCNCPKLY